ncbi:hypothetical protein ACVQH5_29540, partial [Klebsiella pneumoniae]
MEAIIHAQEKHDGAREGGWESDLVGSLGLVSDQLFEVVVMGNVTVTTQITDEMETAAVLALAQHNVAPDIQGMLIHGNDK